MHSSNETAAKVSTALKRVMFEYQISGRRLAEDSGVSEVQISDFRGGKRSPNLENFLKLTQSLPEEARQYFLNLLFNSPSSKVVEKSNKYKV